METSMVCSNGFLRVAVGIDFSDDAG